jgi:hypothetical protein
VSASTYALIFTVVPFLSGIIAVLAHRAAGRRGLVITWALASALLLVLGIIDWQRPPDEGTPLAVYLAFAVVPTTTAAIVAERASRTGLPVLVRMLIAGTAGWLSILVLVGIATLVLRA